MKRDVAALAGREFDVAVVGGGVYGACAARDAALRGLSVALIERDDFCAATSHNSLKIIHGGVRYLQHLNFARMRQSLLERRAWLTMAPHLAEPLAFVTPTYSALTRSRLAFRVAFGVHNAMDADQGKQLDPRSQVEPSRVLDRREAAELLPWLAATGLTGAAKWLDVRVEDANRAVLECVADAANAGAVVANYVEAVGLDQKGGAITGVRARDRQNRAEFSIRARTTINAAGPWLGDVLNLFLEPGRRRINLVRNMNLVVKRHLADYAIGFFSERTADSVVAKDKRLYFMTPWAGVSIIGTVHFPFDGGPDDEVFSDAEVRQFLGEVNAGLPGVDLGDDDVLYRYVGLTPGDESTRHGEARRAHRNAIIDHAAVDGVEGIVSMLGVKYTTARLVAEQTVDLAVQRLGLSAGPCTTAMARLPGARGFESLASQLAANRTSLGTADMAEPDEIELERVTRAYGGLFPDVLALRQAEDDADGALLACRTRYAARNEMALGLDDLFLRRFDWAERGRVTSRDVDAAARVMGKELDWTDEQRDAEVEKIHRQFAINPA